MKSKKVYCDECSYFCSNKCILRKEILRETTISENWEHEAYIKRKYKMYNPAKKNKNNDCEDFNSNMDY